MYDQKNLYECKQIHKTAPERIYLRGRTKI